MKLIKLDITNPIECDTELFFKIKDFPKDIDSSYSNDKLIEFIYNNSVTLQSKYTLHRVVRDGFIEVYDIDDLEEL